MEEIQSKQSNAPTAVYAIARLAETAMKKDAENLKAMNAEHPELKILKEKCKDSDDLISISACHAIVALVENGVLSVPYTLSTFIAILPYCPTSIGITSALGKLLIIDLKMRVDEHKKYKSPFNLQSPQHPLLTVLKQNQNSWHDIINQIAFVCNHPDEIVKNNSSELVKPVVLYMMCDPGNQSAIYRPQLWSVLISLTDSSLLKLCLPWIQMTDVKYVQAFFVQLIRSIKLKERCESSMLSSPNMILQLAGLAHDAILSGTDPHLLLNEISDHVQECCTFTGSCVIIILSHSVLKTPSIYLSSILSLCAKIVKQERCTVLCGKMLIAALLPWLAYPSILTTETLQETQYLLIDIEKLIGVILAKEPVFFHYFPVTHLSVQICNLISSGSSDVDMQLKWLKTINQTPITLRTNLYLLIGGLLIHNSTTSDLLGSCLSFLMNLTVEVSELGTSVLSWILYRLAQECNPVDQLQLLKALPFLGRQKENVALVIHTLESLKSSSGLKCLILNLYLRLWHQEPRCFPYLHKMLNETISEKSVIRNQWNITRAATMKEICDTRPNLHGTELVPILSNILNDCMGDEGALASALALQTIASLCRARIVDVATTWKTLAPRLSKDSRPAVIKSLCDILGLISNVKSPNVDQAKLFYETQAKLWNYVVNNSNIEVKTAALKGLSPFPLDQLSLKMMPPCYRQNLKLPAEYAKTPIDAARKPEDVLTYIPGECWPQLLATVPVATEFIKVKLTAEVAAMRGVLYRHPGKAEPTLPSLPRNSVLLGLITHLRRHVDELDDAVVPCLEVLASPLPRDLPPCNWDFLQKLAQQDQCYIMCLTLAGSQSHCSPSAQGVAEHLVQTLTSTASTKDTVLSAFSILGYLCKGVSPNTLRPFIDRALRISLAAAQNPDKKDVTLFQKVMGHMKAALRRNDIHDANRKLLSMLLESLHDEIDINDTEVFSFFVESAGELSTKFLERISSPSVWWEVTSVKLQKAIVIRSYIALHSDTEAPLVWLNECIDAAAVHPMEQDFILCKLYEVLTISRGNNTSKTWLLELMGHIQAALTSTEKRNEASFLCDVFILSVLVFSAYDFLSIKPASIIENRNMRFSLLPAALHSLLECPEWTPVAGQMVDWLHHLFKSPVISPDTKPVLYKCLQAVRHSQPMQQSIVWQKVVSY